MSFRQEKCLYCLEQLHDSQKPSSIVACGHISHAHCLRKAIGKRILVCPLCRKSVVDRTAEWNAIREYIVSHPLPSDWPHANEELDILCNDCGVKSRQKFHFVGMECPNCNGYNTVEN